ncbi:MAG: hypothetical protein Q7T57_01300 [Dehalococcoidales bacterium]|nr:hypothetical protein [Dehalococcoidales bacterium]
MEDAEGKKSAAKPKAKLKRKADAVDEEDEEVAAVEEAETAMKASEDELSEGKEEYLKPKETAARKRIVVSSDEESDVSNETDDDSMEGSEISLDADSIEIDPFAFDSPSAAVPLSQIDLNAERIESQRREVAR